MVFAALDSRGSDSPFGLVPTLPGKGAIPIFFAGHAESPSKAAAGGASVVSVRVSRAVIEDMIKLAMVRVADALKAGGFQTKMLLQVHDELLFEVPEAEVESVKPVIVEAMRSALPLRVPVVVDAGVGKNWLDAH
jgi:hypothetical protein